MKKINLDVYQLFLIHGSECLWTSDFSVPRPKGISQETDEMFKIIEAIDHRLDMISSDSNSEEKVDAYQKEIEELKSMFSENVF